VKHDFATAWGLSGYFVDSVNTATSASKAKPRMVKKITPAILKTVPAIAMKGPTTGFIWGK